MKRAHLVAAASAAAVASLIVPFAGAAAGPPDAVCQNGAFTGTAHDLIVPAGSDCEVTGATIAHDLIVQDHAGAGITRTSVGNDVVFHEFAGADITDSRIGHDVVGLGEESGADILRSTIGHDMRLLGLGGGTHLESVTIGRDLFASKPQSIQTGHNAPDTPGGPVKVGRDVVIDGSPDFPFVFDGICNLSVGRDLSVTNRSVSLGSGIGGHCAANGQSADTIGRDLILTGSHALSGVFGPSSLDVSGNHVGRDLVFRDNTAAPGGQLEVSTNVVGRDAVCAANNPAVTVNEPNVAGRSNTCG
jgi:hypothetical protein